MKPQTAKNTGKVNSIAARFAMQKRKAIVAACLIGLMIFMWVRVFTKSSSASRTHTSSTAHAGVLNDQSKQQIKIRYVELPVIKGRNDDLRRDFFALKEWEQFIKDDADGGNLSRIEQVNVIAGDDEQGRRRKDILRLVKELTLDAIALGRIPVAFINDTIVSVGGKLHLKEKNKLYELDVIEINENEVVLRYEDVRIELKMPQPNEQDATTNWKYGS